MKLAIMQPYFMPYIGYFQLINAVDIFLIYDDVNYIKQGWINRNKILINGQVNHLTINLSAASSFKNINEININFDKNKALKKIYQAYAKAPYFENVYPLIEKVIQFDSNNLAEFVTHSILKTCEFIEIKTTFNISSQLNIGIELSGRNRVVEICRYYNTKQYINAIGGRELYNKKDFNKENIELLFLNPKFTEYNQFSDKFVSGLSILDIMMFNSIKKIKEMINYYDII